MVDMTTGIIGAGIVGAGSIGSGLIGASASKSAAKAQERAAIRSQQWEEAVYNQTREDQAPWLAAGKEAVNTLTGMVKAGPGKFEESPGYQFRMKEGEKSLERGAAARGGLLGGAQTKALTQFGQDYASNEYDKWLTQWYKSLSPYQSLAQVGQSSAQSLGNLGAQTGSNISNTIMQGGQAQAAGILGQANSWGNALNWGAKQVGNALMYKKPISYNQLDYGYANPYRPTDNPPSPYDLYNY